MNLGYGESSTIYWILIQSIYSWLITLGNGTIWRAEYWSLLLANWVLSSGYSHISLGEWKSMLLSPYITSITATMATLFMITPGVN